MSSWQLIFLQSKANSGAYDGDKLPAQYWIWPDGTWFQKRLRYLQKSQRRWGMHGWREKDRSVGPYGPSLNAQQALFLPMDHLCDSGRLGQS
jgi:hypothetical protein